MDELQNVFFEYGSHFSNAFEDDDDYYALGYMYFGFGFLKLIDCALNSNNSDFFSSRLFKKDFKDSLSADIEKVSLKLISEYSKNFDEHSTENEFNENEKKVYELVREYCISFKDDILYIFNHVKFPAIIAGLHQKKILSSFINRVYEIHVPEEHYSSPSNFFNSITYFLKEISKNEKYHFFTLYFEKERENCRQDDFLRESLYKFLFTDIDLEQYEKINIYDPCCDNFDTLFKTSEFIKNRNKSCDIKCYGKLSAAHSIFNFTKLIMFDFLINEEIFFASTYEHGIPFENVSEKDLDFIISDYRNRNINTDIGFIHQFQEKMNYYSKLVIILNKSDFYRNYVIWMIINDNLEAIITFGDCFILIANSNKLIKRKNKFILIDTSILTNSEKSSSHNVSDCLDIYAQFVESDCSRIFNNEELVKGNFYNELNKYWGIYEAYPNLIPEFLEVKSKVFQEHYPISFEDIEIVKINKETHKATVRVPEDAVFHEVPDVDFFLKEFNFNDLMYDKKRNPSSNIKQYTIGDNKSRICEEKIEYVPLHSIITFDENKIDVLERDNRKIEKYIDSPFYIKSDNFLRKFIVYYLDSDKGKEEFNYFKNGFGYIPWDFIYIRIPVVPIETQEKIIEAYELNEEHYNLVKQSRDNFLKNILDYEKVLKDMEDFNKMEIDTRTGQIIEMSTVKRHMFDGLLWPLSISYLNAVHGTHVSNPNEKLDFYLKLFEFLTAFIDIVLISSIPEEYYNNFKYELWEGISENKYYEATFGTWTIIYSKLLDFYSENSINPKFNNDLIESLLDEEIYKIMDEAREIRNEFPGHGTSIHESRAKQLIDDLKLKIDVVYDVFRYLTGFKLFYSVKVLELFEDGSNLYEVVSLNGPCDQPIYGEVTFNKRLKNNSLYLNNSFDGDLLELDKNLIIFEEVVEDYKDKKGQKKQRATGRFYLYLFNGFKKKKNKVQMRYKCYQIETDEIRKNVSFDEWKEFM